jgi:PAS domain S-box-containing protein
MALFTVASLGGTIPPFFVQGVGPTTLRQWVLGSADILFAFSFLIFMGLYLRNREVFLYWYSSALALTSISLTAFFIESAVGSPIGWAGRFSQYLWGIYFLVAVITAIKSAHVRRTSLDDVLAASLSPAEEKFRALAEHSPDMIDRFDREMKHIYLNQAGLRLYGRSASSIIGKTIEEMGLPGPSVSLLKERIKKVFETAQPMEVEHYIPTKNGTRFYQSRCVPEFGVDGAVANVLVLSRDLTERRRAEEQLREAEEKSRLLIKYAPSAFYEIDFHRPAFKSVNDAMCQLLGYTREGLLAMNPFDLLDDEGRALFRERIRRKLAGENISDSVEYKTKTKDEREVYGVLNMTFTYKDGKPEGAVVVAHDITDRKRMEDGLSRSRDELEIRVQERIEELQAINEELKAENEERLRVEIELRESEGQLRELSNALLSAQERERKMIAGEIHDSIGASLAAAKFKVETTLSEVGDSNAQGKVALESVIPIIQGTIEEARRIQMSLRPSILDDLGILATINWFCRQFESTYSSIRVRKEIEIEEHEVPDSLKIVIYRVLQEALNNIAKHTKASVALLSLRKTSQGIQLVIRDSGQGFDLDEAYSRKGTARGLGLDSMRERIELSGGSFSIESRKGQEG